MNKKLIEFISQIQTKADKNTKKEVLNNNQLLYFLNDNVLTDDESDYLFIGNDKDIKGLIQLSGMCNLFGKFKGSAKQILMLTHKLVSSGKQKEVYAEKFAIFDEHIKEHMKLDIHYSDVESKEVVLDLIYICKSIRSSLTLDELGVKKYSEEIEDKLSKREKKMNKIKEDNIYVENMINKVAAKFHYEPITWAEVETLTYNKKLLTLDFLNQDYDKRMVLTSAGEIIIDEEENLQKQLMESFVDPLCRISQDGAKKLDFEKYCNLAIDKNINTETNYKAEDESTNNTSFKDNNSSNVLKNNNKKDNDKLEISNTSVEKTVEVKKPTSILELLHINNQKFDPSFFLETEYQNVTFVEFVEKMQILEKNISEINLENLNTADKNLYKYLDCKKIVDNIMTRYNEETSKLLLNSKMELKALEKDLNNFLNPMRTSYEQIIIAKSSKEIITKYQKYFLMKEKIENFLKYSNYELLADYLKKCIIEIREISQTKEFDKEFYTYFNQTFHKVREVLIKFISESSNKNEVIKNFNYLLEIEVEFSKVEQLISILKGKLLSKISSYLKSEAESSKEDLALIKQILDYDNLDFIPEELLIDSINKADKIDFQSIFETKIALNSLNKGLDEMSLESDFNLNFDNFNLDDPPIELYTLEDYEKLNKDANDGSFNNLSKLNKLNNNAYVNKAYSELTKNDDNTLHLGNFERLKWPIKKYNLGFINNPVKENVIKNQVSLQNSNALLSKEVMTIIFDEFLTKVDSVKSFINVEEVLISLVKELKEYIFMMKIIEQNIKLKIQHFNNANQYSFNNLVIQLHNVLSKELANYLFFFIKNSLAISNKESDDKPNIVNPCSDLLYLKSKIVDYFSRYEEVVINFLHEKSIDNMSFDEKIGRIFSDIITHYSNLSNNILFKSSFSINSLRNTPTCVNDIFSILEMYLEDGNLQILKNSKLNIIKSLYISYINSKLLLFLLHLEEEYTTDFFSQHLTIINHSCLNYFKLKIELLFSDYKDMINFFIKIKKTIKEINLDHNLIYLSFYFSLKLLTMKTLDFYYTEAQILNNSIEKVNLLIMEFLKTINFLKEESLVISRMLFRNKEEDFIPYYSDFQRFTQKIKTLFIEKFLTSNTYCVMTGIMFSGLFTNVKLEISANEKINAMRELHARTMMYIVGKGRNFAFNFSNVYEPYHNKILNIEESKVNEENESTIIRNFDTKDFIFQDIRANILECILYVCEILKEIDTVEVKLGQITNPKQVFSNLVNIILQGFIDSTNLFLKLNLDKLVNELNFTELMQLILEYQTLFSIFNIQIGDTEYNTSTESKLLENEDNEAENSLSLRLQSLLDTIFSIAKEKKRKDGNKIELFKEDLLRKQWIIKEFKRKYGRYFEGLFLLNLKGSKLQAENEDIIVSKPDISNKSKKQYEYNSIKKTTSENNNDNKKYTDGKQDSKSTINDDIFNTKNTQIFSIEEEPDEDHFL